MTIIEHGFYPQLSMVTHIGFGNGLVWYLTQSSESTGME